MASSWKYEAGGIANSLWMPSSYPSSPFTGFSSFSNPVYTSIRSLPVSQTDAPQARSSALSRLITFMKHDLLRIKRPYKRPPRSLSRKIPRLLVHSNQLPLDLLSTAVPTSLSVDWPPLLEQSPDLGNGAAIDWPPLSQIDLDFLDELAAQPSRDETWFLEEMAQPDLLLLGKTYRFKKNVCWTDDEGSDIERPAYFLKDRPPNEVSLVPITPPLRSCLRKASPSKDEERPKKRVAMSTDDEDGPEGLWWNIHTVLPYIKDSPPNELPRIEDVVLLEPHPHAKGTSGDFVPPCYQMFSERPDENQQIRLFPGYEDHLRSVRAGYTELPSTYCAYCRSIASYGTNGRTRFLSGIQTIFCDECEEDLHNRIRYRAAEPDFVVPEGEDELGDICPDGDHHRRGVVCITQRNAEVLDLLRNHKTFIDDQEGIGAYMKRFMASKFPELDNTEENVPSSRFEYENNIPESVEDDIASYINED